MEVQYVSPLEDFFLHLSSRNRMKQSFFHFHVDESRWKPVVDLDRSQAAGEVFRTGAPVVLEKRFGASLTPEGRKTS